MCQACAKAMCEKNTGGAREKRHPPDRFCAMICAKSPIFIKTTGIDRIRSEKSRSTSSDTEAALRLVRLKKSSNIRKNLLQNDKRKTANGAKLVSGSWCTQQDSNLWPFDS